MPLIKILTSIQKKEFEEPPILNQELKNEIFKLPIELEQQVYSFNNSSNQIHFILMFGYFKITHRFFNPTSYYDEDIKYIASKFKFDDNSYSTDIGHSSLATYKNTIKKHFSCVKFTSHIYDILQKESDLLVKKLLKTQDIFYLLVEKSMELRIEVPSYTQITTIISSSINAQNTLDYKKIKKYENHEALKNLDYLLKEDVSNPTKYVLGKYKRVLHSVNATKVRQSNIDFRYLNDLSKQLEPILKELSLDDNTIIHYAKWVEKSDMHQISRKVKHKQYFDLICFVLHQVKIRSDYLIDIFVQVMQSIKQTTLREHQTIYYDQKHSRTKNFKDLTQFLQTEIIPNILNLESIIKNDFSSEDKISFIENIITELTKNEEFQKIKSIDFNSLNEETSFYDMLENNSSKLQIRIAKIIQNVDFDTNNSQKSFIKAIEHYKNNNGKLNSSTPKDFLEKNIQSLLFQKDENNTKHFRISLYKILFFIEISQAIKSGKLNLLNSYRYRAFESYLLDINKFKKEKMDLLEQYNLLHFANCKKTTTYLKEQLNSSFKDVNEKISKELNLYFHLKGENSFTITTPKVEKDISLDPLTKWLPKDKFIPLISILEEINSYISFTKVFTHYSLGRNRSNIKIEALFASIIGYGCNINISRMAKISKGIFEHDIEHASNWYLSNENLIEANDKIIAFTEQLDIVKLFKNDKDKNHTASDGQKFNISVDSLNAGYSFKYFGLGRGVSRCMFIDESHRLFYSTVINANEREAAYVIDGLMHNDTIQSDIHSTDTFGYSEVVFALTHLLGFSFAPRIKNFKEQQLYAFEAKKEYHKLGYKVLPIKQINIELIEEQWENILRFVLTIKERETTASQLLKRLTSYPKQHKTYLALREFGRIIKTKFLLEYIDDVTLRQQIEKQLNKIENANKFSKAIFFGNNGEYMYATKEEQDIASNSLRLIQNAIICWNYLYFSDKLAKETDENEKSLIIQSIQNGSIVHWQHINFYGEYDFTGIETNKKEFEFNLEKIINLKVEDK